MARKDRIKWLQRIGGGAVLLLLIAAGYVSWNWSSLANVRLAEQVRTSANEDERLAAARKLVSCGDKGQTEVQNLLLTGDAQACVALGLALHESLVAGADGAFLFDIRAKCGEPGQLAIGELLPALIRSGTPKVVEAGRVAVRKSLEHGSPEVTRQAIRLAMRPDFDLKAHIVPALQADEQ